MKAARSITTQVTPEQFLWDLVGERTLILGQNPERTLDLRLHYVQAIPDLSADADTLEMPHPLYKAVEEYATAAALKMDRDPNAAAWEASGNASITQFLGATARQTEDPQFVQDYLGEYLDRG